MRRAQLVADAVAVLCPWCAEPQPNKEDGSEQWTAENFEKLQGRWKCVACDAQFLITKDTRVMYR